MSEAYQLFKNMLWVTLPWFTVAAVSGQWFHQCFRTKYEYHIHFSVQMCRYFYIQKCGHRHPQIQLHLTFHKIQPIVDVWYMMSANKCPHRQPGYLNAEMRLFTFLISSPNNSKECCKTNIRFTAKDVFKQRKTLKPCTPSDLILWMIFWTLVH